MGGRERTWAGLDLGDSGSSASCCGLKGRPRRAGWARWALACEAIWDMHLTGVGGLQGGWQARKHGIGQKRSWAIQDSTQSARALQLGARRGCDSTRRFECRCKFCQSRAVETAAIRRSRRAVDRRMRFGQRGGQTIGARRGRAEEASG